MILANRRPRRNPEWSSMRACTRSNYPAMPLLQGGGPHPEQAPSDCRAMRDYGLATSRWITVDDTAAWHILRDGFATQIRDCRFTAFRTGETKPHQAFLIFADPV
jgi:hypothetical protein